MNSTRREFVGGLTLAGTAGLLGVRPDIVTAEPPPETTRLRLVQVPALCFAPLYLAEEIVRAEGFRDVTYLKKDAGQPNYKAVASGEADLSMAITAGVILQIDAGDPIVLLAGVHTGCYDLFGNDRVRTIRDLKGKTVAVPGLRSGAHAILASMVAYVGLDPDRDVNWVEHPPAEERRLFEAGKVDAVMAFPPWPQEFRARKIGHSVVNTATDRPWSQYFCCSIIGNREFARKYPTATKRVVRAILKAAGICASEPGRAARFVVDKGYAERSEYALQAMQDVPFGKWREYDPQDTVRFYALRLHEAGLIKSSPQKILAQGTDWRFLNELKKELKG